MDAYFERLAHEGSKSLADARGRAKIHILQKLGNIAVADLTRDMISRWLAELAGKPDDDDAIRGTPGLGKPRPDYPARGLKPSVSRWQGCLGCTLEDGQTVSRS
jgi:hypothetical protein